jgi:hypothetical protein
MSLYGLVDTVSGNLVAVSTTAFKANISATYNVTPVMNVPVPAYTDGDPFGKKVHQYDSVTKTWTVISK